MLAATMEPPSPKNQTRCRIWVLEDHGTVRDLLLEFIATQPQFSIAGASGSAAPFLAAVAAGEVDIVLLDLMLDDTGGLRVLELLQAQPRPPKVIVFSALVTLHTVQTALQLGVSGYVEKAVPIEMLRAALERVAAGGIYLSPCVSALATKLVEQKAQNREPDSLTPRELSALAMIASGMNAKAIARALGIAEPTAYKLKNAIAHKLKAPSDQELTLTALRMGLISAESAAQPPAHRPADRTSNPPFPPPP